MIAVRGHLVGLRDATSSRLDVAVAFRCLPGESSGVDLVDDDGLRAVHFKYRAETADMVLDAEDGAGWSGAPQELALGLTFDGPNLLRLAARTISGQSPVCVLTLNDVEIGSIGLRPGRTFKHVASYFPESSVADLSTGSDDQLWRYAFSSEPSPFRSLDVSPRPGTTAVIRAHGPSAWAGPCVDSLADLVTEVVFVDASDDVGTRRAVEQTRKRHKNVRLYTDPAAVVRPREFQPRPSRPPERVHRHPDFALTRVLTPNFVPWTANRICLRESFRRMLKTHDLLTRSDPVIVRGRGFRVYKAGERYFADVVQLQEEPLWASKAWGAHWTAASGRSSLDSAYEGRAKPVRFEDPVFGELVDLTAQTTASRAQGAGAADRALALTRSLARLGAPPAGFQELPHFSGEALAALRVQPDAPEAPPRESGPTRRGPQLGVFCLSDAGAPDRQASIRATWAAQLNALGVPVYFVIGDPAAERSSLHGDVLRTPTRDAYEHRPEKVLLAARYALEHGFDHMIKVDDDCVLNPATLIQRAYAEHDYCGAAMETPESFNPDQHLGRFTNEQLDTEAVGAGDIDSWFAGRAGYALSRGAMEAVLASAPLFSSEIFEDIAVARALANRGLAAGAEQEILASAPFERFYDLAPDCEPVDVVWGIPASEIDAVHQHLQQRSWSAAAPEFGDLLPTMRNVQADRLSGASTIQDSRSASLPLQRLHDQ